MKRTVCSSFKILVKHYCFLFGNIVYLFKYVYKHYIDFQNKTFETDNVETFPLMFDVDESITLEEFQELIDKSESAIKEVLT